VDSTQRKEYTEADAFEMGILAGRSGVGCPFEQDSQLAKAWWDGFFYFNDTGHEDCIESDE
jgi:hypothetical protein